MRQTVHGLLLILSVLGGRAVAGDDAPGPAPGRHLDITIDRHVHDFGVAGQGEDRETTFTYRNTSDAAIESIQVRADCGCNAVKLSKQRLDPDESGTLTVGFHTGILSGRLTKRVRMWTSRRERGEIVVPLRIAIVAGLIVAPGSVSFKDVRLGAKPSTHFDVKWHDRLGAPFEVTSVEVPGHDFAIETKKYAPEEDDPWRGYRVSLGFKRPPPLGVYSAEVIVRTTHPDHRRLSVPLTANVVGRVWMQTRTLHFGVIPQGTARTATLKFRPRDPDVTFDEVSARSVSERLRALVKPDPHHRDEGYWLLSVTVPEDIEPGRLDDEIIELHTGVEGEVTIDVQVRGRVRARR